MNVNINKKSSNIKYAYRLNISLNINFGGNYLKGQFKFQRQLFQLIIYFLIALCYFLFLDLFLSNHAAVFQINTLYFVIIIIKPQHKFEAFLVNVKGIYVDFTIGNLCEN